MFRPILTPWPDLTPSQDWPGPTWPRPNLTPFGPIWLYCLRVKMGQAQLDSFWPNLTLPFVSFLLLVWLCQEVNGSTTFWLFQGVNNRSPSWLLAHFDPAVCFFLLFTASLTLSGGKEQKPILTLGPFWPCCLFLSCCSLLVWLCQGVNSSSPMLTLSGGK